MNVVKASFGDTKVLQRGLDVPLDFGSLARDALSGPHPYLLLQRFPNKLGGNEFPCGTYGRMG